MNAIHTAGNLAVTEVNKPQSALTNDEFLEAIFGKSFSRDRPLVCAKPGGIQIHCYQTQNDRADNRRHIALRAAGHPDNERTEDEGDIARVLDYVTETHNRQCTHQPNGRDNVVADDGHYHRQHNSNHNK